MARTRGNNSRGKDAGQQFSCVFGRARARAGTWRRERQAPARAASAGARSGRSARESRYACAAIGIESDRKASPSHRAGPSPPHPFPGQVKTFFARGWKRSPAPYGEDAILADLTAPLRSALLRSVGLAHRARLPLLAALGDECLGHIVTLLWTMPLVRSLARFLARSLPPFFPSYVCKSPLL